MSNPIQTAALDWQIVDGIDIPVSKQFGDVYFSKDNGLLETRHVFLNGNDLPQRLSQLSNAEYFCVGETGFGTGLNILALWQLWQQVRPNNHSHLHVISVEKFPLSKSDLIRALNAWPELEPLAQQLIAQYPHPIAGCHRLNFPHERFSLDLWLGDAHEVFPTMAKTHHVHAWFLDGFAPACNPDMWEEHVLAHIVRLSAPGTSFASFSVAGVLKRGLQQHGIQISRPRGFGHKREMLKAIYPPHLSDTSLAFAPTQAQTIAIIGAGIAGLSTAWAFAQRGHQVHLFEKVQPLDGASGNPLALLNPKLCPIQQSHQHLMTLAWQYAQRHYAQFKAFNPIQIHQVSFKKVDELMALKTQYPQGILSHTHRVLNSTHSALTLHDAGTVQPHVLQAEILQHPNISLHIADIQHIEKLHSTQYRLISDNVSLDHIFNSVIVCGARDSKKLFTHYPNLKPIRGQVSWFNNALCPLPSASAYSYGGYCMPLNSEQLILGASFYPERNDTQVLAEDHQHNLDLLAKIAPHYTAQLTPISTWQGRASVRAQSADYFPLLGQLNTADQVYTLAGLGSKGFLFAPLCAEVLVAQVLQQACPIPQSLLNQLQAHRFEKKLKVKKPYFKS